jgi:hypothetical protein
MTILTYALAGIAIGAIYCVWAHYTRDRTAKQRKLRSRVAYMLWAAARKSKFG